MATPTVTNVKRLSNFFFDLVYTDTKKLTIDHFTIFGDYIDIFKLYFKRCVCVFLDVKTRLSEESVLSIELYLKLSYMINYHTSTSAG